MHADMLGKCLPNLVCLLTVIVTLVVLYLTHHLLYHLEHTECDWSPSNTQADQPATRPCSLHSFSGEGEISLNLLMVESVIDGTNMTVRERSNFQREQVDLFCDKYNLSSTSLSLPQHPHHPVYRHLLVNHDKETLFCYVPKVGCTNLKVLFFVAQGLLPAQLLNVSSHRRVKDHMIKDVVAANSLVGYTKKYSDQLVQFYYKYIMYRHPLERLVSAYRNKVQRFPLTGLDDERPHYNWLRKRVYKHTHSKEYKKWLKEKGVRNVSISFQDFVSYWLENHHDRTQRDEHLVPIFELCEPCRVRYNYYGHFETFEQDANVLIKQIGTKSTYLRRSYYNRKHMQTSVITRELFKELSGSQKLLVLKRLARDIDFFYHIFPSQKDSHKNILGIAEDLPVTYP